MKHTQSTTVFIQKEIKVAVACTFYMIDLKMFQWNILEQVSESQSQRNNLIFPPPSSLKIQHFQLELELFTEDTELLIKLICILGNK